MAIRNPTSQDKATMTVITIDKKKFVDCDIPAQPFAQEGLVSFWYENKLIGLPIAQVARIELNFNE